MYQDARISLLSYYSIYKKFLLARGLPIKTKKALRTTSHNTQGSCFAKAIITDLEERVKGEGRL